MFKNVPESTSKKRVKRGKRKNEKSSQGFCFYYNNVNGYGTKSHSISKIVGGLSPDIVALCETKRPPPPPSKKNTKKKELIPGYEIMERNLKIGREGLLIGAKKNTFSNMQDVTESELKNLFTVRIFFQNFVLRVILIHAPQETEKV